MCDSNTQLEWALNTQPFIHVSPGSQCSKTLWHRVIISHPHFLLMLHTLNHLASMLLYHPLNASLFWNNLIILFNPIRYLILILSNEPILALNTWSHVLRVKLIRLISVGFPRPQIYVVPHYTVHVKSRQMAVIACYEPPDFGTHLGSAAKLLRCIDSSFWTRLPPSNPLGSHPFHITATPASAFNRSLYLSLHLVPSIAHAAPSSRLANNWPNPSSNSYISLGPSINSTQLNPSVWLIYVRCRATIAVAFNPNLPLWTHNEEHNVALCLQHSPAEFYFISEPQSESVYSDHILVNTSCLGRLVPWRISYAYSAIQWALLFGVVLATLSWSPRLYANSLLMPTPWGL